jgi:hypothetical protein
MHRNESLAERLEALPTRMLIAESDAETNTQRRARLTVGSASHATATMEVSLNH